MKPACLLLALLPLSVALAQTTGPQASPPARHTVPQAPAVAPPAPALGPPGLVDAMRGPTPILEDTRPPLLRNAINDDNRLERSHPMQPPVIPHRVDGYQVTRDFNKCMDCHAAERTAFSQAVPVSLTHYLDRNGRKLDRISTRRYFCQQCHVAQDPVQPLIGNRFRRHDGWPAPAGNTH